MAIEQVQAIIHGKKIGGQGQLTKASGITFDNTGTDLVAETAQAAIVEVNAKTSGLTRMTTLWENPAPTASFASQSITLNSDDYDFLLWTYMASNDSNVSDSVITEKGRDANLTAYLASSSSPSRTRVASFVNNTQFNITNCFLGVSTQSNNYLIPLKIYGIKLI